MSRVLTGRHLAMSMARRFAESNMVSVVRITRTGSAVLDEMTGVLATPEPSMVYEGKARVAIVSGPVTMSLGDEPQYFSGSSVSIPVVVASHERLTPLVDDLIEILVHDDPLLVGLVFRVLDVEAGGHMQAARRMQVTGAQRAQNWSGS